MKQALAIIEFAMNMEREGQFFFAEAASKVKTAQAKMMFSELAKWEETHWEYLKAQRESIIKTGKWAPVDDARWRQENLAWEIFYKRGDGQGDEPLTAIDERTSDLSALRLALFIENDLHGFYDKAIERTDDPEGKKVFRMLSEWEKEHRQIIETEYEKLKLQFWNQMGFAPF